MRYALGVLGPAPVAMAWERYADPGLWSIWAPQIRSVTWAGGGAIAPGRSGVVHAIAGVDVPFTVTEVDARAHDWSWIVRPLGAAQRWLVANNDTVMSVVVIAIGVMLVLKGMGEL